MKNKDIESYTVVDLHSVDQSLKARAKAFETKKRLGQNFLISANALGFISDVVETEMQTHHVSHVLEIGPGIGFLTEQVMGIETLKTLSVIDVDKDALKELPKDNRLQKHLYDASQFDFGQINEPIVVMGNLPFNVATKIVLNIIGDIAAPQWNFPNIKSMVLMFQYEVAERLSARVGSSEYNQLSVLMQAKAKVEFLFDLPSQVFHPAPKVRAGVLLITPHYDETLAGMSSSDIHYMERMMQIAFSMRRKVISNSLKSYLSADQLRSLGIEPTLRPQNLMLDDYIKITKFLRHNTQP